MLYPTRPHAIRPALTAGALAALLTEGPAQPLCAGFEFAGFYYLNDGTTEAERFYAIFNAETRAEVGGLIFSLYTTQKAADFIASVAAGALNLNYYGDLPPAAVAPLGSTHTCKFCNPEN